MVQGGRKRSLGSLPMFTLFKVSSSIDPSFDPAQDMFLMDVGTEDGMLWRSKQLYNALKKKNVIVEAILEMVRGAFLVSRLCATNGSSRSCEWREI